MRVVCLGSTGFHPTETAHTSCFMIPSLGVVFDAGTGFFRVIKHLTTPYLDIFLSHGHTDHIIGISGIYEIVEMSECKTIRIHGEPQVLDAIKLLFQQPFFPICPKMEFVPLTNEPLVLQSGAVINNFHLKHRGSCVGYRLEYLNKSIAYVTDTTSNGKSSYISNIKNVDLLIHELYFGKKNEAISESSGHTCTKGLKELCTEASINRVVIMHHDPNGDHFALKKELFSEIPGSEWAEDRSEFLVQ